MTQDLLTLDELCARVAIVLAEGYTGAPNDRVRDLPDRRTVRYYSTLGLLDRPTIRGRSAYYGRRHLLQLVAVKRLQAQGASLGDIQSRLIGLPDAELATLARLPAEADARRPDSRPSSRRDRFWTTPPAEPEPTTDGGSEKSLQTVRLSGDVMLLLPLARTPDEFDREALRVAAGPLLKLLASRKLIDD